MLLDEKHALERALIRVENTALRVRDTIPYRTDGGKFDDRTGKIDWWTNGFWPGILWLAYRHTKKKAFAEWAEGVENKLDAGLREFYALHHDVGFMWHLSAVANYTLTGNLVSAKRGYIAASILASRFNPVGSFIRAWNGQEQTGWAIIDCMMNLAILYWAATYMHDPRFANIAEKHAETVMRHFIRGDGSSKHICHFDPKTGEYIENFGGQGYDVDSAWSRGMAWALYGFAISAKYTGRQDFLHTAMRVANFFIAHLPDDSVPFADFKAPMDINIHKDSSAAAIAASGLLLLSRLVPAQDKAFYRQSAVRIVAALYTNYTNWERDEALLQKGCTAFHADAQGVETTLIYGDYFFLEALMQLHGYEELF